MPIPKPGMKEKQKDFVSRCMGDRAMVSEFEKTGQRAAACYSSWKKAKKTNMMVNQGGKFIFPELKIQISEAGRRETINEIEYAIYPVVLLVEGVHHGAIGDAVYYPASVLEASAPDWGGMPVPVQHPNVDGQYLMCEEDVIRADWCVGHVGNINYADGKLSGEVFIEVKVAEEKHPGLLASLDAGEPMEVSTGLLALEEKTEGQWNGEDYAGIINEIIPDHLALLPGNVGACSFEDGCGIRANKENKMVSLKRIKEAAQSFAVNELSHSDVYQRLDAHTSGLDVRDGERNWTKMHYVREVFEKYFIFVERTPDGVKLFKQDYSIDSNDKIVFGEEVAEVKEETRFVPVSVNSEGGNKMADKKPCCPEKVSALIANEHSAYTEKDREALLNMDGDQLDKIVNTMEAALAAGKGKKPAPEEEAQMKKDEEDKKKKANGKDNTMAPVTLADYLAGAPAEIRGVLNAGMKSLDKARAAAIAAIKANAKAAAVYTDEMLMSKDLAELEALASLATPDPAEVAPSYLGFGGTFNTTGAEEQMPYVPRTLMAGKTKKADA